MFELIRITMFFIIVFAIRIDVYIIFLMVNQENVNNDQYFDQKLPRKKGIHPLNSTLVMGSNNMKNLFNFIQIVLLSANR